MSIEDCRLIIGKYIYSKGLEYIVIGK